MRKIEQEMIDAIQENRDWSKANTTVSYNEETGTAVIRLHGNKIAEVDDDSMTIFDGGWRTNTTKSRLNALCSEFCIGAEGVFQEKFEWYVHKFVGQAGQSMVYNAVPFENGYVFS